MNETPSTSENSPTPRLLGRLQRISSKPPMVAYLSLLFLLGMWRPHAPDLAWIGGDPGLLLRAVFVLTIYSALDLALGYWKTRRWILPSSSWISGLIVSLVLAPSAPWPFLAAAPALASLSKHLVRISGRHIFNPAAFALVTLAVLRPNEHVISWWGASWGVPPLLLIIASGLVTIIRIRRWRTWLAFALVYLIGAVAVLAARGVPFIEAWTNLLRDGTFWFFSTVMLIEPVTTAYRPASLRTAFGAGVGALVVLWVLVRSPVDPFLVPLLLGNLLASTGSRFLRR